MARLGHRSHGSRFIRRNRVWWFFFGHRDLLSQHTTHAAGKGDRLMTGTYLRTLSILGPLAFAIFSTPATAQLTTNHTRIFAPYQDMSLTGMSADVIQNDLPEVSAASGIKHFTMAFISSAGNACKPEWGGVGPIADDSTFTKYIKELRERGGDVIISFGGFTADTTVADGGGPDFELGYGGGCTTVEQLQAAYQAVIDKYSVDRDHPVALDFDIESDAINSPVLNGVNTVDLRNQALARLAKANPGLQISFTVPCAESGLIQPEMDLVESLVEHKVPVAILNPLPFDFGSPIATGQYGNVVTAAATDVLEQMKSLGLEAGLGITVLIGTNDESDETFLLQDAKVVEAFAEKERSVQRLSFWEASRDNGSCDDDPNLLDDNNCSSITQGNWSFSHIFERFEPFEKRDLDSE
ncbi:MAG TPA: hypothetical protein VI320_00595 [Terracidiphilus sp.]